jgi:hypothetical protein
VSGSGTTTADLAARLGLPVSYTEALLRDEQERGHVEHVEGVWRLTTSARDTLAPFLQIERESPQR